MSGIGPTRKQLEDTPVYSCARHPQFDEMWAKHKGLVFYFAVHVARVLNRCLESYRFTYGDFLGYLTILFNKTLYDYQPNQGKFSVYYSKWLFRRIHDHVLRYEAEQYAVKMYRRTETKEERKVEQRNREFFENDYFLYRVPQNHDWADEMVDLLGGVDQREKVEHKHLTNQQAAWEYLMRDVSPRNRLIMEMRLMHDKSMVDCAEQFGITKQRVEQIERVTKLRIRERLEALEPVRRLFYG